ncbi:hypothetical protein BKA59DRAFT_403250 [Fusarium tricinctum]|uniref:Uncharacterized protein n=1 Tax=Fusarium tricinctum TaxID=61284 RepID=A0A8K0RPR5_9HYPO|nr:hypothetical protein BKA59DRAFT_403250 [Fusarium tricinctum]
MHNENGNLTSINGILYILNKPRILIYLLCRHAIRPGRGIKARFQNIHKYTGNKLKAVLSFCGNQEFQDPTKVPLPANGNKAIPQLLKLGGVSCDYCEFLSIDKSNVRNHHNQCQARHGRTGEKGWRYVIL